MKMEESVCLLRDAGTSFNPFDLRLTFEIIVSIHAYPFHYSGEN